jgi:putative spermidine/putrescine transport system substrate-binding protein
VAALTPLDLEPGRLTINRSPRRVVALLAIVAIAGTACGGDATPSGSGSGSQSGSRSPSSARGSGGPPGSADPLTVLADAAEQEGGLTTIALSHDWCNYGEALTTFATKYDITIKELSPDAGFSDQIAAIKAGKDGTSPDAPDVIDVGLDFAVQARKAKLLAPYKVATWDSIPASAKDPDGAWYGDYYGVLAFETNRGAGARPPTDWADLLEPRYADQIGLAGDPRLSGQAIETVYAAALANGGSLDNAKPGLDFFAKLHKVGNLVPTIATPDSIDQGPTPITVRWTYNALAHRDRASGTPDIDVTVPATGRLGGIFVQAISASALHPNAARLWMEFLYSDEGQNIWLKGNCLPIRYDDLAAHDAIPADVLANLPDVSGAVFPTLNQLNAASTLISQGWNAAVGVDIRGTESSPPSSSPPP